MRAGRPGDLAGSDDSADPVVAGVRFWFQRTEAFSRCCSAPGVGCKITTAFMHGVVHMATGEPSGRIDVLVLEDHPDTRRQLIRSLASDPRLSLAAEAESLSEARAWLQSGGRARVALVDIGLPDGSGVELIRELTDQRTDTVVLVITAFGDEKIVVEAIEAGAMGYLLKERDADHVVESIFTVLDGGSPISPSIARQLLKRFQGSEDSKKVAVGLTQREKEVLCQVVKGFSYKEIADHLELSIHTVTSHIQHVYRKLSVRSRGEAAFEAIQLGLIDIR